MWFFTNRILKEDVRRLLFRYSNRDYLRLVKDGPRTESRGAFCRPIWIVPCVDGEPQFDAMFSSITKDIHPEGLSLVHHVPLDHDHVWVAFDEDDLVQFVKCRVAHSTPLGLGYFLIGLHAVEVIEHSPLRTREFRQQVAASVEHQPEEASGSR
jgi:hypothetical protein